MRERIHSIVAKASKQDIHSRIYDIFICVVTIFSLTPLMFKEFSGPLVLIDTITVYILMFDYLLRWITADMTSKKDKGLKAFIKFPFRILSIIAIFGIIPSLGLLSERWKALRVLRIFGLIYYSSQLDILRRVLEKQRKQLLTVLGITISYIFAIALVIYSYEPQAFENFFQAVGWATTTLTSVNYHPNLPETIVVQMISILSSLFGIGIIALPTGIITSGFMSAIRDRELESANNAADSHAEKHFFDKQQFFKYAVVIIICALLNNYAHKAAVALELPVWLDTIGTMLAAIILEPASGLIVGFINNLLLAVNVGNYAVIYFSISAVCALLVGIFVKKDGVLKYKRIPAVGAVTAIVSSVLSFLIYELLSRHNLATFEGALNVWEHRFYAIYNGAGINSHLSIFGALFTVKVIDVAVCLIIVSIICLIYYSVLERKNGVKIK